MSGEEPYVHKVDRRTAIAWVGAASAALAVGGVAIYGGMRGGRAEAKGYGTDPKLAQPEPAPWPRILTDAELQTAAILADFILPASGAAPSASAIGVPDFIDEWVSAPYPDQLRDRPVIRGGLRALSRKLLNADAAARARTLAAAQRSGQPFFKRFRALTIGAYYTTEAGFRDIGYIGNVVRASDPGPSPEVKAALELQLAKLGL